MCICVCSGGIYLSLRNCCTAAARREGRRTSSWEYRGQGEDALTWIEMFNFFQFVIIFLPSILLRHRELYLHFPPWVLTWRAAGKANGAQRARMQVQLRSYHLVPVIMYSWPQNWWASSLQQDYAYVVLYDPCSQVLMFGFFIFICSCACSHCI